MDKAPHYRALIKEIIERFVYPVEEERFQEFETQVIFDDEGGHYYLLEVGWEKGRRIHGFTLHIDLKGEKIWIQQDWTEDGAGNLLVERGVPKEDIVLAFHSPSKRPYTGFAVA